MLVTPEEIAEAPLGAVMWPAGTCEYPDYHPYIRVEGGWGSYWPADHPDAEWRGQRGDLTLNDDGSVVDAHWPEENHSMEYWASKGWELRNGGPSLYDIIMNATAATPDRRDG